MVNRMEENSHQFTKTYFLLILEFFSKHQDKTQINYKESIFNKVINKERSKWQSPSTWKE